MTELFLELLSIFTLSVTPFPYMKTTAFWKLILLPSSGGDDIKKYVLHLGTQQYECEVSILLVNHWVIGAISQKIGGLNCTAAKE